MFLVGRELPAATLVVAIDCGKAMNRVMLASAERGVIGEPVSLPTLREGVDELEEMIARAGCDAGPVIAIEATGSLHRAWARELERRYPRSRSSASPRPTGSIRRPGSPRPATSRRRCGAAAGSRARDSPSSATRRWGSPGGSPSTRPPSGLAIASSEPGAWSRSRRGSLSPAPPAGSAIRCFEGVKRSTKGDTLGPGMARAVTALIAMPHDGAN